MMRILRLYAPSLIGDHTLCYVSTNRAGNVCINDVETSVLWARAGEPLGSKSSPEDDFGDIEDDEDFLA